MSSKATNKRSSNLRTSSFLLEPFLKPVGTSIENSKQNPVLRALFGGQNPPGLSPWTFATSTSNCHPFKKTELSHDLATDDMPAEIPKSLIKKPSSAKHSVKEISLENKITPSLNKPNIYDRKSSAVSLKLNNRRASPSPPITRVRTTFFCDFPLCVL